MRRVGSLLLALFLGLALGAQAPFEALYRETRPAFRVHTQRGQLPSPFVAALALDPEGSLWAGTVAGLAKYDGQGWHAVEAPCPPWRLWVNNNALGFLEDGTLWCGTRSEGLLLLKNKKWTQIGVPEGLPVNAVNTLLESRSRDRGGRRILYVGTYGGGLACLRDGRWEVLDVRQGLASNHVFALAEGPDGGLYVATRNGVSVLRNGTITDFEAQKALPSRDVRQLLWTRGPDGTPTLWLGLLVGGPCSWSEGKLSRHVLSTKGVSCIIPSRDGGVWVSFWGTGLARWNGRHWETWGKEDGLPSAQLRCLAEVTEDGRSVLWIGSDGRGVLRTAEGGWRQFQPKWRGEAEVRSFAEGPDGSVWMAGRDFGLLRFDGAAWRRWDVPGKPITGDIRSIAWWRGQIWAGCDIELAKLGPRGLEAGAPGTLLDLQLIRCLLPSRDRLWVGTANGLLSWDGTTAQAHPLPAGAPYASVRCLALTGGRMWVGTDGGLLYRDGSAPFIAVPGFEPGEGVLSLADSERGLFLGTSAGRILAWRNGALEIIAQGQPGSSIVSLIATLQGRRLYAGTLRGIEAWDTEARQRVFHHTVDDGLPEDECQAGALFQDSQGRIWAGTGGGAGVHDPATYRSMPAAKTLFLNSALTASGPKDPGFTLARSEGWLRVSFALRAHHREEDTRYRTQLLPVEGSPGEWAQENQRLLQRLPRGSYTLKVWARDFQGLESGPIEFPFKVTGSLWEHPLFLGLSGAVLLVLGGLLVRARMVARERKLVLAVREATAELSQQKLDLEDLARQQRELMGILAHDIRNPLSGIALTAELLSEEGDEPERRRSVTQIRGAVTAVTGLLNRFLGMQAMEAGRVDLALGPVPVAAQLREVASLFQAQAAGKEQRLAVEAREGWAIADPRMLEEVLSNLVSNALKFSPRGSKVSLAVQPGVPGRMRIAVQDEGPGLSEADKAGLFQRFARLDARPTGGEQSVGLGLSISKRLVEAMGGRIGAESEPGQGATFWIELPACDPPPSLPEGG